MATISFQCYSCGQVLRVGQDKAGKKGKCPKCSTMLTIPVASTITDAPPEAAPPAPAPRAAHPAPGAYVPGVPVQAGPLHAEPVEDDHPPLRAQAVDEEYDEAEPAYAPRSRGSSWWKVKVGLLIVFIAFCVAAGGYAIQLIGYLLDSIALIQFLTGSFGRGSGAAGTLLGVGMIIMLIAYAAAVAGYVFCILGPNRNGTMPLAITTTALGGAYLLLILVTLIVSSGTRGVAFGGFGMNVGTVILNLLSHLVFAASLVIFSLYLKAVSGAQKRSRYGSVGTGPMVMACIYGGLQLLMDMLAFIRPSGDPRWLLWIILFLRWAVIGVFIAFLIMYILAVWRTRSQVK